MWWIALGLAAQAQPATACPAKPVELPADLAGWRVQRPVAAAASPSGAPVLTLGEGARASLHAADQVVFAISPARRGPGAHGGVFLFDAPRAGRYRVALETPGWVEVVREGRAVASTAHGHGPPCSGIRKLVDFDLRPGRHLLQVAGAPNASVTVLVAPLP